MVAVLDVETIAPRELAELPLDLLDGENYRAEDGITELAETIRTDGRVLSPIRVVRAPGGRYRVIGGNHRTAAVRLLGWPTIPAWIEEPSRRASGDLVSAISDNLTHHAASDCENAEALARAVADGWTVDELASRMAKRPAWITARLELMDLAERIRPMMARRGFVWCAPLYGLPESAQIDLVARLEQSGWSRAQWVAAVARYRSELDARALEDSALFSFTVEEWSTDDAAYLADLTEPETAPAPVVVRERVLGLADLADHVGAKRATAYKWQHRGQLPPPDLTVSGGPAWFQSTVDAWHASR